ncbi:insulin-like peptide 5 isoform X2 [Rhodnius prolixus]|uniref:insulin-like peptide 5 isoform X2 n=1 Tax=Rhodnius prolixus TaxID=13249 RepID=UPI003D18C391
MMYGIMKFMMIISIVINSFVISAPLGGFKFCGKDLSDILAEVCSGRGYNVAFDKGSHNNHRTKRGIVDECCRRFCTWTTLEAYCSPVSYSPTPSDKFSVRKRNELKEKTQEIAGDTYAVLGEPTRHQKRKLFAHSDIDPHWPETSLRFSSQIKASHNNVLHGSYPNNKVKRNGHASDGSTSLSSMNDLLETEGILAQLNDPHVVKERIRHPRTHSSRAYRLKKTNLRA